jgi:hypothetical protein
LVSPSVAVQRLTPGWGSPAGALLLQKACSGTKKAGPRSGFRGPAIAKRERYLEQLLLLKVGDDVRGVFGVVVASGCGTLGVARQFGSVVELMPFE